jgi:hypothetical protein
MSFDLYFARPRAALSPGRLSEAFEALGHDMADDLFEPLPLDEMLAALSERFQNFEPSAPFPAINTTTESAEVFTKQRMMIFCFRGKSGGTSLRRDIIATLQPFGCDIYDPQSHGPFTPLQNPAWEVPPFEPVEGADRRVDDHATTIDDAPFDAAASGTVPPERGQFADRWDLHVNELQARIERQCAAGRWRRTGLDAHSCAAMLHNVDLGLGAFEWPIVLLPHPGEDDMHLDVAGVLAGDIAEQFAAVVLGFLESVPPGHPSQDVRARARAGVDRALLYFYGDWREGYRRWFYSAPITAADARTSCPWIAPYRQSLLLALFLDDHESLSKIVAWPDTDLPVDDDLGELTAADNKAHMALAAFVRGDLATARTLVADIEGSRKKRAVLFAHAASAIAASDSAAFAMHLKELIALFRKSGFGAHGIASFIHVDGSILWHAARRAGLSLPALTPATMDLLLHPALLQ